MLWEQGFIWILSPLIDRYENRLDQHLTGRRWLNLILTHGKVQDKITAEESFQDFQLHKFMKKDFGGKRSQLSRCVVAFFNW